MTTVWSPIPSVLIFEKDGFDSLACYSAEQALEHAQDFHPHLLLCDVAMPGRDGIALVNDISQEFPSCRFLVLTGFYEICTVSGSVPIVSRCPSASSQSLAVPADLLREANAMLVNA